MGILVAILIAGYILWEITGLLFTDEVEIRKKRTLNKIVGAAFLLSTFETNKKVVTVKGLVDIGEDCHQKLVQFTIPEEVFYKSGSDEPKFVIIIENEKAILVNTASKDNTRYEGTFI